MWITNGTIADIAIVWAKTEEGIMGFVIEKGMPGFDAPEIHSKMSLCASVTSELYFDNVRIPAENILGRQGDGFHQMLKTLDGGRLSIAAMGLGGAQGAYEMALKYAKSREQFGQPVSKFQAVAFKLADCAMEIECGRNLLYKACWLRDKKRPFAKEAAMAKLYCSEVMYRAANHSVQLHGGYGYLADYGVEKIVRDLQDGGLLSVTKRGRRNRYRLHRNQPLRHTLEAHCSTGELLDMVNRRAPGLEHVESPEAPAAAPPGHPADR